MSRALALKGHLGVAYPQRSSSRPKWYEKTVHAALGRAGALLGPTERDHARFLADVKRAIPQIAPLRDPALREAGREAGRTLRLEGLKSSLVAQCFAVVQEMSARVLGMRHYDVQLLGGYVLLNGRIAEMETGEGKTLTATLAAATSALAGIPVHVITVNDYLAARDAEELAPLYEALGLTVGVIQQGMSPVARRAAYGCDITYCTNKEVAFDYLKDRIALGRRQRRLQVRLERLREQAAGTQGLGEELVLRGLFFAIVDEADSVLVDEARTPLIISGEREDAEEETLYRTALELARALDPEHYVLNERERIIELNEAGRELLEGLRAPLGGIWNGPRRSEELVAQALSALHLFEKDVHYILREDKLQIVDEYTGRVFSDRSWERGLHQMIEAKEGVELTSQREPLARTSYQRFFSKYLRLSGMTGTAKELSPELWSVYHLAVVRIPTHRPVLRRPYPLRLLATEAERWQAVVEAVLEERAQGRPVLVGTRTVSASEHLSEALSEAGIPHQVLNARQDAEEAHIVAQAGASGQVTVATNMAGRGTDIKLGAGVESAGGLHVIMTELHDSRRIDRQLFGRCARQGDRGSYQVIVSLEDELLTVHGTLIRRVVAPFLSRERAARSSISAAQNRAERLHAAIRAELLEIDRRMEDSLAFSGKKE